MCREAEGRLRLARNDVVAGMKLLVEAAELEFENRGHNNDPPDYPRCLYNVLGEIYLDQGSPRLAIAAFEKALEVLRNNGYAWAGLARAHHTLGDMEAATSAYARMLHVWGGAEMGIWQLEAALALGLDAEPLDPSPAPQRSYATETLATLGPNTWEPYIAPELEALDPARQTVRLDQYYGKNVLLIFYLSEQCVHCVEQLYEVKEHIEELRKRDCEVLAISADPPERNAASDLSTLPMIFLSDSEDHANALRFHSYDEFEDLELHSTNLIDRHGRMRWARTGGDPFTDMEFLIGELGRIEALEERGRVPADPAFGGR
jgi:peroxiredoxin